MKTLRVGASAILLLMGLFSAANAEYLIYLKGGHFIVVDDCTLSISQGGGNSPETGEQRLESTNVTQTLPRTVRRENRRAVSFGVQSTGTSER